MDQLASSTFNYYCILDFESCHLNDLYEITDFPVLLLNNTAEIISVFHKYIKTEHIDPTYTAKYIKSKYGPMGLDHNWEKSISFKEAMEDLQIWLVQQKLLFITEDQQVQDGLSFAWVTCGDWDLGRMLPSNCKLVGIEVPKYMQQWINVKVIYCQHHHKKRRGMKAMLASMNLPLEGFHHSGMDDCKNISKILAKLLVEGAKLSITSSIEKLADPTDSYSDFKMHHKELEEEDEEKQPEEKPKPQVVFLVKNGVKDEVQQTKQITTTNWVVFLKQCGNKLSMKGVKRIFREDGSEVFQVTDLKMNEKIIVSSGEELIK